MANDNPTAQVFNIQRFCVHDGPGIRTNVFLVGCDMRCKWCQNPEGLSIKPRLMLHMHKCIRCGACIRECPCGALYVSDGQIKTDREKCTVCGKCVKVCFAGAREMIGMSYTVDDLFEEVLKDKVAFRETKGGVTLSGGEPTLHADFVIEFFKKCKANGINTAIETNGNAKREKLKEIAKVADLFLMDIKLYDEDKHKYWTGVSNKRILSNFKELVKLNKEIIPRIPFIPGVNDEREEYLAILSFIRDLSPELRKIHILPFHQLGASKYEGLDMDYAMAGAVNSEDNLRSCVEAAKEMGFKVDVGGSDTFRDKDENKAPSSKHILYEY